MTIYLSLRAKVTEGTIFMKSPVLDHDNMCFNVQGVDKKIKVFYMFLNWKALNWMF